MAKRAKVLVIAGTTAVGKTDLSLELSKRLGGEIVSADSVQVYRHMDIGSAKVDAQSQRDIPHHLIDVYDLKERFSAGDYYKMAKKALEDIISQGKVPIVVGGTSFYIRFLLCGPTGAPQSTDESRRVVDELLEDDNGDWEKSLSRLQALDPEYASTLFKNDWIRLKRALDICLQSGRSVTSFKQDLDSTSLPYNFKCLFLTMPRVQLFNRIDHRCELLIQNGLLKETVSLVNCHGLCPDTPAGSSIGYRQSLEYLDKVWGYPDMKGGGQEAVYTLKVPQSEMKKQFLDYLFLYQARTRQLAQQQLVWFKKEKRFHWLNMAPGQVKLSLHEVASHVEAWFRHDTALPDEWNGAKIQYLSAEEIASLKTYTADQFKRLKIYSDGDEIEETLEQLKTYLESIKQQKTLESQ